MVLKNPPKNWTCGIVCDTIPANMHLGAEEKPLTISYACKFSLKTVVYKLPKDVKN